MNLTVSASMYFTLASEIGVGQGINVGPGQFDKKNKRRALDTVCVLILYTPVKSYVVKWP